MWPNPQFPTDLVTFTEETLNGKLHFLCSESFYRMPENLWKLCISTKFRHQDIRWNFGILRSVIIGKIVTRYLHFIHSFFDKPHFNKQHQTGINKNQAKYSIFWFMFQPKINIWYSKKCAETKVSVLWNYVNNYNENEVENETWITRIRHKWTLTH